MVVQEGEREPCIFLAPIDTEVTRHQGKDQICLCSLHNFDAYVVTRVNKAPKGYIFAVKSTDNLSFFEDTSDYMHQLCCSEKDGAKWMEKILLARVSPAFAHILTSL